MVKCYSQSPNNIITQIDDDKLPKNFDLRVESES